MAQLPIIHKNGKEHPTSPDDRKKTPTTHKSHGLVARQYSDVEFYNGDGYKTENTSQNAKHYEFYSGKHYKEVEITSIC